MKVIEFYDVIYWLTKAQIMQVWIWKTASREMGMAVEHLFFLAGSPVTSGLNPLCVNAAWLWKHLSPDLWIDILHNLDCLQKK